MNLNETLFLFLQDKTVEVCKSFEGSLKYCTVLFQSFTNYKLRCMR